MDLTLVRPCHISPSMAQFRTLFPSMMELPWNCIMKIKNKKIRGSSIPLYILFLHDPIFSAWIVAIMAFSQVIYMYTQRGYTRPMISRIYSVSSWCVGCQILASCASALRETLKTHEVGVVAIMHLLSSQFC